MKSPILSCLLCLSLILTGMCVQAQSAYTISGKVTDENEKPLVGATVFIDGSKLATATQQYGNFQIIVPGPGSYHVSVNMIGYTIDSKNVMLKEEPANITFKLSVKTIALHEVKIGTDKNWQKNFDLFKAQFLGTTPNALKCKIINPEVINFSTKKNMLFADADDFLIIENPQLGYRIKYLLKTFQHNEVAKITSYDGDVVFEELTGDDKRKQEWAKNRLLAYNGSLTHFLRSVFTNTSLQEGFIASQMYERNGQRYHDRRPVKFDTIVTAIDTNFISLKFKALYIVYDKLKATQELKKLDSISRQPNLVSVDPANTMVTVNETSSYRNDPLQKGHSVIIISTTSSAKPIYQSELISYAKNIVVDDRGRVFGGTLLSFLIRGTWTYKRVGDQLPYEYQPPVKTS